MFYTYDLQYSETLQAEKRFAFMDLLMSKIQDGVEKRNLAVSD